MRMRTRHIIRATFVTELRLDTACAGGAPCGVLAVAGPSSTSASILHMPVLSRRERCDCLVVNASIPYRLSCFAPRVAPAEGAHRTSTARRSVGHHVGGARSA